MWRCVVWYTSTDVSVAWQKCIDVSDTCHPAINNGDNRFLWNAGTLPPNLAAPYPKSQFSPLPVTGTTVLPPNLAAPYPKSQFSPLPVTGTPVLPPNLAAPYPKSHFLPLPVTGTTVLPSIFSLSIPGVYHPSICVNTSVVFKLSKYLKDFRYCPDCYSL